VLYEKWTQKRDTVLFKKQNAALTWVVGMELNLALVVRQLPVESAYGLHALPSILRQGFGSGRKGVADHPFIELTSALNNKNEEKC